MSETWAHWNQARGIVERVIVTGNLILLTPTHLGNGEADGPTDMTLLRDPLNPAQALLTGASIAGALRNYLREKTVGYDTALSNQGRNSPVTALFGGERGDADGAQSALIVDDALSVPAGVLVRDGVRIDPRTGAAMTDRRGKGFKFDLELLAAGTVFPLRFELLIPQGQGATLKAALAQALQGLERGEIPLGARKRRGLGRCQVKEWRVVTCDLTRPAGLLAWIKGEETAVASGTDIAALLGVTGPQTADQRTYFEIRAVMELDGSLLIRSEADAGPNADVGHLHTRSADGQNVPVLPGTSLAGVLRHRALRIANTLSVEKGSMLVETMFGHSPTRDNQGLTASRLAVNETVIRGTRELVQTRVRIDRFTGGAYPTGLFGEKALWGGPGSQVTVEVRLRNPQKHEIGLLLLLLKDLWTGDLPVGGERSIGRGRLKGRMADLCWKKGDGPATTWRLEAQGDGLQVTGNRDELESCVGALTQWLEEGNHD